MVVLTSVLELNQLEYNPRIITEERLNQLIKSIASDPTFMHQRPILVNEVKGVKYVYAGTQRLKACILLGMEEVPTIIDKDLPKEVLNRRILLDNTHSGKWDFSKIESFEPTIFEDIPLDFDSKEEYTPETKDYTGVLTKGIQKSEINLTSPEYVFEVIFSDEDHYKEFNTLTAGLDIGELQEILLADED